MGLFSSIAKVFTGGSSSKSTSTNTTSNITNIDNIIDMQPVAAAIESSNLMFAEVSKQSTAGLKSFEGALLNLVGFQVQNAKVENANDNILNSQVSDGLKVVSVGVGVAIGYVITRKKGKK